MMASVCYVYLIPQLTSTSANWSRQNFMRHETQKALFNGNSKREITIDNVDSLKVFFFVPIYHKSVSMDQRRVSVYHHKCFNDGQAMTHCTTLTETPSFTLGKRTHEKRKQPACFYGLEFPAS